MLNIPESNTEHEHINLVCVDKMKRLSGLMHYIQHIQI